MSNDSKRIVTNPSVRKRLSVINNNLINSARMLNKIKRNLIIAGSSISGIALLGTTIVLIPKTQEEPVNPNNNNNDNQLEQNQINLQKNYFKIHEIG